MQDHLKFEKLGGTLDDAVGECYDKVARVVGIPYPGGPSIDRMAHVGNSTYKLPLPLNDDSYNFSFSGLKSAVINLSHNEEQRGNELNKEDLASSFQDVVVEIISKKVEKAIEEKNIKYFITAGGVAANKGIRERLAKVCEEAKIEYSFPEIRYCTDNAAMIGSAAYYYLKNDKGFAPLSLSAKPTVRLDD
jgi:N6-L-threonylcarbamoyladenine synthase